MNYTMVDDSDILGAFGLSELDKVKKVFKAKDKRVLPLNQKQYDSIKSAYSVYLSTGRKPLPYVSAGTVADYMKNYTSVSRALIYNTLAGMVWASKTYPEIGKVLNPVAVAKAKSAVKDVKKKTSQATKSKDGFLQPITDAMQKELDYKNARGERVQSVVRNMTIGVVAITAVVLVMKFKKNK